jgi:(1->4)-alpha-D-glucan 1-alpha-D-glucosylmutase
LYLDSEYLPIEIEGQHKGRVVAFARKNGNDWVISVSIRCIASVQAPITGPGEREKFWNRTELRLPSGAPKKWKNILAGDAAAISGKAARINVGAAFEYFPLALLQPA